MKKILFYSLLFIAPSIGSCSDDSHNCPDIALPSYLTVSFEPNEGIVDPDGNGVVLGDIEVEGGAAEGIHSNVYWAKGREQMNESVLGGKEYRGTLAMTADGDVGVYTKFSSDYNMDNWGGFVLSKNYNNTASELDYDDQFSSWATSGANGTETFIIGYDQYYAGTAHQHLFPAIELNRYVVEHLFIANATLACSYVSTGLPEGEEFFFNVIVECYDHAGAKVGTRTIELIKNGNKVADWVKVPLSKFGYLSRIQFVVSTNDAMAPKYFCVDELVIKEYN